MTVFKNPIWAVLLFGLFSLQLSDFNWQIKKQTEIIEIIEHLPSDESIQALADNLSDMEKATLRQELRQIRPKYLTSCQTLKFYDLNTYLTPNKTPKDIRITFPETIPHSERIANNALLSRTDVTIHHDDEFYAHIVPLNKGEITAQPNSLLRSAEKYAGQPLTYKDLHTIAITELTHVQEELNTLQTRINDQNIAPTLDTLAAQDQYWLSDDLAITQQYDELIRQAIQALRGHFFAYDIPPAQTEIIHAPHFWHAAASYQADTHQLKLYKTGSLENLKNAPYLVVHEVYPGHHLHQVAQATLGSVCGQPISVGRNHITEGWATYAEHIADKAGFLEEPGARLGWLDYRAIRAVRILMDIERAKGNDDREALRKIWNNALPSRLHDQFDWEYKRLKKAGHRHLSYLLCRDLIQKTHKRLSKHFGENFNEALFYDAILRGYYPDLSVFEAKVLATMQAIADSMEER